MDFDFGETVTGRVADDDGSGQPPLVRPAYRVTGEVMGLFPTMPGYAQVKTPRGFYLVKVESVEGR